MYAVYAAIFVQNPFFAYPTFIRRPRYEGSRRNIAIPFGTEKLKWLSDGEKISKISLFILTQLTNVIDTHADSHTRGQTPHDGIGRAYASHRAAKSTVQDRTTARDID